MKKIKHFLSLEDFSAKEIKTFITASLVAKKKKSQKKVLQGKRVALVFTKSSTRTRASFEVAVRDLGGYAVFFSSGDSQFARGESVLDTLKVLERYFDVLVVRNNDYKSLRIFSNNSKVPVINALTEYNHPCQAIADGVTILEHKKKLHKMKIAYLGDGNNVAVSLALLAEKLSLDLTIATPRNFTCPKEIENSCSKVSFTNDPLGAVKNSDVIYTDTWFSMGEESKKKQNNIKIFSPFQINQELITKAKKDFIFMHCLPAYRGKEVTSEIIDGEHSVVFDQAENRLFAQKAILQYIFS